MAEDNSTEQDLLKTMNMIQNMIDISAERLEGLRTKCSATAGITQQEIRTLEGKLVKMFSNQLVTKSKLHTMEKPQLPSLTQWLKVVGLSVSSIQGLCQRIQSIEELQEKTEHELKNILNEKGTAMDDAKHLCKALYNLKRYTDILKHGDAESGDFPLYWTSWEELRHPFIGLSPKEGRSRAARASVPSEESLNNNRAGMKFPTTPPARMKHCAVNNHQSSILLPDIFPLTKSKSHESQLAKIDNNDVRNNRETNTVGRRGRLPTEPGPEAMTGYSSPILTSPAKSPPYNNAGTDSDDSSYKSVRGPPPPIVTRNMTHQISHRFQKTFKMMATCGVCMKSIYFGTGLKCKECKYKCHRECEEKAIASCGLPDELLYVFKQSQAFDPSDTGRGSNTKNYINSGTKIRKHSHPQSQMISNIPSYNMPDSNSSSCNSSTPSSPALQPVITPQANTKQTTFNFPDIPLIQTDHVPDTSPMRDFPPEKSLQELTSSQQSKDSDKTISITESSTDSDRTPVRINSQDSQVSDTDTIIDGHRWPRQNSLSMREWEIPFDDLTFGEVIGAGRFGKVYRGYWHGDVAIKVLDMESEEIERIVDQYKIELNMLKKTRHENLMLFMGTCTNPKSLTIVTSLSRGYTLYHHIHILRDKFNLSKLIIIAQQIALGMGYLHAKDIVHKDLKSKNIFMDNGKVVISDFGIFTVTKLCFGKRDDDRLGIPPGWLCYLAPEIQRCLRALNSHDQGLPFSQESDVYAFGTIWYELLTGEWPFKGQPPEAIIWQVGKGMKHPLANLHASRDLKDILMLCWSFKKDHRPAFAKLQMILEKLPKKRLARSPSHPIHLSRSAESVF
ncbi:PREDICTED: kinase suppressor of Ras 2 isoform X2 [Nicrophorus vespilloides]|uniref:Kinase suppressor of Ras 2 isoform X2 n=1 Tax=Nicrophorus vespilloides TaxID=110193 RepID=A0ABM1MWN2_NICVS|nr:PREDICTED: kinase suppressor of Ras 2 isoform X2 [Nicrophorus vespilloides]